jgi:hypothetical protein
MLFDIAISHSLVAILMHLLANGAYAFENEIASSVSLEMRRGPVRLCGIQNSRISCPEGFCCSEDVRLFPLDIIAVLFHHPQSEI